MSEFVDLYDKPHQPIEEMSEEEVRKDLAIFRNLWTWLDDETRAWLCHIRYPVRFVRRDYKGIKGLMGRPHLQMTGIEIDVVEEQFDYTKGMIRIEQKTVVIPLNQIVSYEFIHQEEELPMEDESTSEEVDEEEGELSLESQARLKKVQGGA